MIIAHRQVHRFKDDFDKALLLANVEASCYHAAATGTHSYLEDGQWLDLHQSLARDGDLTVRSRLALKSRLCLIRQVEVIGLRMCWASN